MKRVYRWESNETYWDRRWSLLEAEPEVFSDLTIYPIRYALRCAQRHDGEILDIGCGRGRLLKHFVRSGRHVVGIERSGVAVERLRAEEPLSVVDHGDVVALPYEDGRFGVVFAFGVYHNLESGIAPALRETARVLAPGGGFVISVRPHNAEMVANEWYWRIRNWRMRNKHRRSFHKLLVREREFASWLAASGLVVDQVTHARNMSILYRLPLLRSREVADPNAAQTRSDGYRLNSAGRKLDALLRWIAPRQFSNVIVFEGHRA